MLRPDQINASTSQGSTSQASLLDKNLNISGTPILLNRIEQLLSQFEDNRIHSLARLSILDTLVLGTLRCELNCLNHSAGSKSSSSDHSTLLPHSEGLLGTLNHYKFSVSRPLGPDEISGLTVLTLKDEIGKDLFAKPNSLRSTQVQGADAACTFYATLYSPYGDHIIPKLTYSARLEFESSYTWDKADNSYHWKQQSGLQSPVVSRGLSEELDILVRENYLFAESVDFIQDSGRFRSLNVYCSRISFSRQNSYIQSLLESLENEVEGGLTGASITIRGLLNADFITELTSVDENGVFPYPNIELIYALPLPSGSEYRFTIKAATNFFT